MPTGKAVPEKRPRTRHQIREDEKQAARLREESSWESGMRLAVKPACLVCNREIGETRRSLYCNDYCAMVAALAEELGE